MTEIVIDKKALAEEIRKSTAHIAKDVKRVMEMKFTAELLSIATPAIEVNLKSATNLPTKGGLRQFYDEQSDVAKANKGWRIPKNTKDPHFIQMWHVDWEQHIKTSEGKIILSNPKMVAGREAWWSLFDILWWGTDYYVAPVILNDEERARLTRQRDKNGAPLISKWSRDKEKYYENRAQGRALKNRGKIPRRSGAKGAQGAMKTGDQIAKEFAQYRESGIDSFGMKLGGMEEDDFEENPAIFYQQKATSPLQTQKHVRTSKVLGVVEFVKSKIGKWGKKVPYSETTLYDVSGGDPSYHQKPAQYMHFYNRFKGRFYYNQLTRKGVEGEVVQDFHDYVTKCIDDGLQFALNELSEEEIADIYYQSRFTK
jgi:hypothetical protein